MRKVMYNSIQRPTKAIAGCTEVTLKVFGKDGEADKIHQLGSIFQIMGTAQFDATAIDQGTIGIFGSKSQAGEALKKHWDSKQETPNEQEPADPQVRTLTLAEAAEELCPNAKNKIPALRKRLKRMGIEIVDVDGDKCVALPIAA